MSDPAPHKPARHVKFERERGVYAIDVVRDVAHAIIELPDEASVQESYLHALRIFTVASIPVFCVKMHRTALTLAFAMSDLDRTRQALASANLAAEIRPNLCFVATRAAAMRDLYGVMSSITDALGAVGATIYTTSDAHNTVQCLVEEAILEKALVSLRQTFGIPETAVFHKSIEEEETL